MTFWQAIKESAFEVKNEALWKIHKFIFLFEIIFNFKNLKSALNYLSLPSLKKAFLNSCFFLWLVIEGFGLLLFGGSVLIPIIGFGFGIQLLVEYNLISAENPLAGISILLTLFFISLYLCVLQLSFVVRVFKKYCPL